MLELFWTFLKIGLFTFGGGYAMIPLVQQEVVSHGWMDAQTLIRYIAICESTPGPIAVNMATFIGSAQYGLLGAIIATLGVVLPSFVIILLIAALMKNFRENRYVAAALGGIRPVVAGMIAGTGIAVSIQSLQGSAAAFVLDVRACVIGAVLLGGMAVWQRVLKKSISAILLILVAAALGIIAYGV